MLFHRQARPASLSFRSTFLTRALRATYSGARPLVASGGAPPGAARPPSSPRSEDEQGGEDRSLRERRHVRVTGYRVSFCRAARKVWAGRLVLDLGGPAAAALYSQG